MHSPSPELLAQLDWHLTEEEQAERVAAEEAERAGRFAHWGEGPEAEAGMRAALAEAGIDVDEL